MCVCITDYIDNPDIEKKILGGDVYLENNQNAEVLLVWHQKIDRAYLEQFPNLKGVVRYGVGFDSIDLDAIREKGIVFCNTPDYGTDEVSDTAIGMIMNISRGISQYDHYCRSYTDGTWQENTLSSLTRTNQLTIGVIGAGRIGGSVLRKANAIGFNTVFFDPYRDRGYEKMLGVDRVDSLDELLSISDIVSIHTPLTDETRNMVDQTFVNKMKSGSAFINTARGEIVTDVDIFIDRLKSGEMSGLALDVLPEEPPEEKGLIAAWKNREEWLAGRVIINPHSSYYSQESYLEMRQKASINAKRILEGEQPFNIISK